MNYIISLADKSYLPYIQRLFHSVRGAGWRGEIILFTPDDNVYCNEKVVKITRTLYSPRYKDCRWMIFDGINEYFKRNDKILFFDADCNLSKNFPIADIFKHDFVLTKKYKTDPDAWPESFEKIEAITGLASNEEYVTAPFLWKKCRDNDRLFNMLRIGSFCSFHHGGGINVTLTSVLKAYGKKIDYFMPYDKILYTSDPHRQGKARTVWLTHYGGGRGKEMWGSEYA